jgi:hypothetical protein
MKYIRRFRLLAIVIGVLLVAVSFIPDLQSHFLLPIYHSSSPSEAVSGVTKDGDKYTSFAGGTVVHINPVTIISFFLGTFILLGAVLSFANTQKSKPTA